MHVPGAYCRFDKLGSEADPGDFGRRPEAAGPSGALTSGQAAGTGRLAAAPTHGDDRAVPKARRRVQQPLRDQTFTQLPVAPENPQNPERLVLQ